MRPLVELGSGERLIEDAIELSMASQCRVRDIISLHLVRPKQRAMSLRLSGKKEKRAESLTQKKFPIDCLPAS
jgi:hypothetical protein